MPTAGSSRKGFASITLCGSGAPVRFVSRASRAAPDVHLEQGHLGADVVRLAGPEAPMATLTMN